MYFSYVELCLLLFSISSAHAEQQICEYRCNLNNCVNNEVWHEVEMDGPNGDKIILQQTLRQRPRENLVGSFFPKFGGANYFRKLMDAFVSMNERRRGEHQYRNELVRQRFDEQRHRLGRTAAERRASWPTEHRERSASRKEARSKRRRSQRVA